MSMTKCRECEKDVSTMAASCPNCGCPISSENGNGAIGTQAVTIQETSKKLKIQLLLSGVIIFIGIILIATTTSDATNQSGNGGMFGLGPAFPIFFTISGIIWYIVTRVKIWWHHK